VEVLRFAQDGPHSVRGLLRAARAWRESSTKLRLPRRTPVMNLDMSEARQLTQLFLDLRAL